MIWSAGKFDDLKCKPSSSGIGSADRQIRMLSHFLVNDDEKPQSLLSEISSDDMK